MQSGNLPALFAFLNFMRKSSEAKRNINAENLLQYAPNFNSAGLEKITLHPLPFV
jgi:hypothetical protein